TINTQLTYVKIVSVTGTIPIGNVTLGAGTYDPTAINSQDVIGDVVQGTGIRSFDSEADITKIAVLGKAIPAIDQALANYADERKDLIALLRTPVGISPSVVVDYREGTG